MRDFAGLNAQAVPEGAVGLEEYLPILRRDIGHLDYFLRDLSRGMQRITQGEVPNGSGDPIADAKLSDLYFVLLGRIGNQTGHGGTASGGTLTLSSTSHATKGFIYLGADTNVAYDETQGYLGIGTTTPAAQVHLVSGTVLAAQRLQAATTYAPAGWRQEDGAGLNLHLSIDEWPSDDSVTFIQQTAGATSCNLTLAAGSSPGVTSGHVVRMSYKNPHPTIAANFTWALVNVSGTGAPTTNVKSVNFSIPANTDWTTYSVTLSTAEVANIVSYAALGMTFYTPAVSTMQISTFALELPATGDPLQKWSNGTELNTLRYADDANANTTLEMTGDILRIATTALEFDIGTPVANYVWAATDAEGTGAWTQETLLDGAVHGETADASPARGSLIYGNADATSVWDALALGTTNYVLTSDGTDVAWADPSTNPLITGAFQPLDADLTQIAALANTAGHMLYTNGTPEWALLAGPGSGNKWLLSTGANAFAWSTLVIALNYANGESLQVLADASDGVGVQFTDTSTASEVQLTVPAGGLTAGYRLCMPDESSGAAIRTLLDWQSTTGNLPLAGSLVYGAGASTAMASLTIGASGTILQSNGSAPGWVALSTVDHGAFGGLTDDDHTQYVLLAGRSGGTEIIGGTGSGDDLRLTSTSNATKGNVFAVDAEFLLEDNSDSTKHARFELSAVTTGQTRILQVPDASGQMVLSAGAQNLLSKTLATDAATPTLFQDIGSGTSTLAIDVTTYFLTSPRSWYALDATGTVLISPLPDSINIQLGTTTGSKIGTGTTQKLGFWNATPVVQPATTGTTTGYTGGGGTALTHSDTFTGNTGAAAYTIGDIVLALKQAGIMAA